MASESKSIELFSVLRVFFFFFVEQIEIFSSFLLMGKSIVIRSKGKKK